jgi:hypothetical protein
MAITPALRDRLTSFNRLLRVIYDHDKRFSALLSKRGILADQIEQWQQDREWLNDFLNRLQIEVVENIKIDLPAVTPAILIGWYGLDSGNSRPEEELAESLQISLGELRDGHSKIISYLQNPQGRREFETAVFISARPPRANPVTPREWEFLREMWRYRKNPVAQQIPLNDYLKQRLNILDTGVANLKKRLQEKGYLDEGFKAPTPTYRARQLLAQYGLVETKQVVVCGEVIAGRRRSDEVDVTLTEPDFLADPDDERVEVRSAAEGLETLILPPIKGERRAFALRVVGVSMINERIFDGDYVIFSPYQNGEQPAVGALVVAKYLPEEHEKDIDIDQVASGAAIPDDSYLEGPTLKYYYPKGGKYRLSVRKGFKNNP